MKRKETESSIVLNEQTNSTTCSFPKPALMMLFDHLPIEDVVLFQRVSRVWLEVSKVFLSRKKEDPKIFSTKGRRFLVNRALESMALLSVPIGRSLSENEIDLLKELELRLRAFKHVSILHTMGSKPFDDKYMMLDENFTHEEFNRCLNRVRPHLKFVSSSEYFDSAVHETCCLSAGDFQLLGRSSCNPASHADLHLRLVHPEIGNVVLASPRSAFGHPPALETAMTPSNAWAFLISRMGWE